MAQQFVGDRQYQKSSVPLLARVLAPDGLAAQQADVSSATLKVYLQSDPTTAIAEVTLTVSSVFFDTLQTDPLWTVDSTGYNFKYWTLPAHLPNGGQTYLLEVKLVFVSPGNQETYQHWIIETIDVFQA